MMMMMMMTMMMVINGHDFAMQLLVECTVNIAKKKKKIPSPK